MRGAAKDTLPGHYEVPCGKHAAVPHVDQAVVEPTADGIGVILCAPELVVPYLLAFDMANRNVGAARNVVKKTWWIPPRSMTCREMSITGDSKKSSNWLHSDRQMKVT